MNSDGQADSQRNSDERAAPLQLGEADVMAAPPKAMSPAVPKDTGAAERKAKSTRRPSIHRAVINHMDEYGGGAAAHQTYQHP